MNFHGTEVRQKALDTPAQRRSERGRGPAPQCPARHCQLLAAHGPRKRGECPGAARPECPRCDGRAARRGGVRYLLGLYLGDGHISQYSEHRVPSLMITCADAWPGLMDACEAGHARGLPGQLRLPGQQDGLPQREGLLQAPALPVPPARPRQEARAPHRPRSLAAGDRRRPPLGVHPRAHPLRRLPDHQLDDPPGRRRAQALRVPAVLLHQHVRRHPAALHGHARQGRRRVDAPRTRQRPVQHLRRPQASVALMDAHIGPKY